MESYHYYDYFTQSFRYSDVVKRFIVPRLFEESEGT